MCLGMKTTISLLPLLPDNVVIRWEECPNKVIDISAFWKRVKYHVPWFGKPRMIEVEERRESSSVSKVQLKNPETAGYRDEQIVSRSWHTSKKVAELGDRAELKLLATGMTARSSTAHKIKELSSSRLILVSDLVSGSFLHLFLGIISFGRPMSPSKILPTLLLQH